MSLLFMFERDNFTMEEFNQFMHTCSESQVSDFTRTIRENPSLLKGKIFSKQQLTILDQITSHKKCPTVGCDDYYWDLECDSWCNCCNTNPYFQKKAFPSLFEMFENDKLTIETLFERIGERDEDFAKLLKEKHKDSYFKGKNFTQDQNDVLWTLDYRKCEKVGCDDYYTKNSEPCPSCHLGIPALHLQSAISVYYKEESEQQDCPICLSVCEKSLGILKCGHKFHVNCIQQWLDTKTKCPCCREVILENEEEKEEENYEPMEIDNEQEQLIQQQQESYYTSVYDTIEREHRHTYLRSILCALSGAELVERFCVLYGEYVRTEFEQNTDRCNELYDQLLEFYAFNRS